MGNPYQAQPPTEAELRKRFFFCPPRDQAAVRNHERVSQLTFELALQLCTICPPGRNLSIALTDLESVRMRANAAIACDDPRPAPKPKESRTMPPQEFIDLVTNLKAAIAAGDTGKAETYRNEIEQEPQHIDYMAAMIP